MGLAAGDAEAEPGMCGFCPNQNGLSGLYCIYVRVRLLTSRTGADLLFLRVFRNLFYLFAIAFKVITVDNSHLLPHRIQTSQQLTSGRLSRLAASTKPFPSLKHPKRPSRLRGPRLSRHRTATAQTGQPTCCPISLNRPPTAACALVTSAAAVHHAVLRG